MGGVEGGRLVVVANPGWWRPLSNAIWRMLPAPSRVPNSIPSQQAGAEAEHQMVTFSTFAEVNVVHVVRATSGP